jgi:chromosome segregation ATPase
MSLHRITQIVNVEALIVELGKLEEENAELKRQLSESQNYSNEQYKQNLEHIQTVDQLKRDKSELQVEIETLKRDNVELRQKVEMLAKDNEILRDEMSDMRNHINNLENERLVGKIVVACNDLTDELKTYSNDENMIEWLNELGYERNSKFGHYIRRNDKSHVVQYKKRELYNILKNLTSDQIEILFDVNQPLYELLDLYKEYLERIDYSSADKTSEMDRKRCKRMFGL